jgi:hypothetical protein
MSVLPAAFRDCSTSSGTAGPNFGTGAVPRDSSAAISGRAPVAVGALARTRAGGAWEVLGRGAATSTWRGADEPGPWSSGAVSRRGGRWWSRAGRELRAGAPCKRWTCRPRRDRQLHGARPAGAVELCEAQLLARGELPRRPRGLVPVATPPFLVAGSCPVARGRRFLARRLVRCRDRANHLKQRCPLGRPTRLAAR